MHTTQYPNLFLSYREGLDMNTGNKKPNVVLEKPSFTQSSMSSSLVFDSVRNKNFFLDWMVQIVLEL